MAINQWFRHDAGLMRRPEVVRMMMKHGWQGYGIYVGLLEYLFENGCGERHAVGLEPEMLAYVLRADVGVLSSVITDFGLFVIDEGMFWSDYISRSVDDGREMQRARQQAGRQGASRRWKQKETDASDEAADSEPDESPDNARPSVEECQNDGKSMANRWQSYGKRMAKLWQSYGKPMAKR